MHSHAGAWERVTIQAFIREQLLNAITVTRAPILLGEGIPLFGKLGGNVELRNAKSTAFANDFVQIYYELSYS